MATDNVRAVVDTAGIERRVRVYDRLEYASVTSSEENHQANEDRRALLNALAAAKAELATWASPATLRAVKLIGASGIHWRAAAEAMERERDAAYEALSAMQDIATHLQNEVL